MSPAVSPAAVSPAASPAAEVFGALSPRPGRGAAAALLLSALLHGAVVGGLARSGRRAPPPAVAIPVALAAPPPPVPATDPPVSAPASVASAPRPAAAQAPRGARTAVPGWGRAAATARAERAIPVFGLPLDETVSHEGVPVPAGNTMYADPARRPRGLVEVGALAPGPPPASPMAAAAPKRTAPPGHDAEACGESMRADYLRSAAHRQGVEGEVRLRVELDERGGTRAIRVLTSLGAELDALAARHLRRDPACAFTPARGPSGEPSSTVVSPYVVRFELAR